MVTPLDFGVSSLPMWVFMIVHAAALAVGGWLAWRAGTAGHRAFAWGFGLFGVSQVVYMLYHVNVATFLLSHTIAEVVTLVAFVVVFIGIGQSHLAPSRSPATTRA